MLTHTLQYQQKDGSWKDGFLAYTKREAEDVAREGIARTGRMVRVVKISDTKVFWPSAKIREGSR